MEQDPAGRSSPSENHMARCTRLTARAASHRVGLDSRVSIPRRLAPYGLSATAMAFTRSARWPPRCPSPEVTQVFPGSSSPVLQLAYRVHVVHVCEHAVRRAPMRHLVTFAFTLLPGVCRALRRSRCRVATRRTEPASRRPRTSSPGMPPPAVLRLQVFSTSWRLVPPRPVRPCFMPVTPMGTSPSEGFPRR
jgi:anti-sigma factor RsiW